MLNRPLARITHSKGSFRVWTVRKHWTTSRKSKQTSNQKLIAMIYVFVSFSSFCPFPLPYLLVSGGSTHMTAVLLKALPLLLVVGSGSEFWEEFGFKWVVKWSPYEAGESITLHPHGCLYLSLQTHRRRNTLVHPPFRFQTSSWPSHASSMEGEDGEQCISINLHLLCMAVTWKIIKERN